MLDDALADGTRWVQILQEGSWKGHPAGKFAVGRGELEQMVANANAQPTELCFDYNHTTCNPFVYVAAPAAGWIKELAVRETQPPSLWARVAFTPRASKQLEDREYRYVSPAFDLKARNHVTGEKIGARLHSVALTNTPFLRELPEVPLSGGMPGGQDNREQEMEMDEAMRKTLAEKFGLPADATAEQVLEAAGRAAERGRGVNEISRRLGLSESATVEELLVRMSLQQQAGGSEQRVTELEQQVRGMQADRIIEEAQREGKLSAVPEQVKLFHDLAVKDPAAAQKILASMPRGSVVPVDPVKHPEGGPAPAVQMSDQQRGFNSALGVSDEDFAKFGRIAGEEV